MEFLKVDDELSGLLRKKATRKEIDDALENLSFTRLKEQAVAPILSGEISLAEILKLR